MKISKKTYAKFADAHAPRSPMAKNCLLAFTVGGTICTVGQILRDVFQKVCSFDEETAGTLTSASLILVAVVLTAVGVFDKIAKHAGAGTLVPNTGFANAVVSPAIDSHSEGLVLGVGAKIFSVAGPVLLYGTLAGFLYGVVHWICQLF